MALHPQVQAIRDRLERENVPSLYTLPIEEAREADVRGATMTGGEPEAVHEVRDLMIPGPAGPLAARIYRPAPHPAGLAQASQAGSASPPAVLVYFFGGGWSLGTLDTSDAICRMITNRAGCVTISVSYRLAPEHKFPCAVDDCYAGTAWIAANAAGLGVDATRIAVGGDSSGGNLAAAVTLLSREHGGPPLAHQLLVYPNTEYGADTDSMRQVTDKYLFNPNSIAWYWGMYLRSAEDGASPLASPLRAGDLSGLPSATMITAEYDPLRDEAEDYARKLSAAGVPAEIIRYDGMMHGFFTMVGILEPARDAVATASDRLRRAFAS